MNDILFYTTPFGALSTAYNSFKTLLMNKTTATTPLTLFGGMPSAASPANNTGATADSWKNVARDIGIAGVGAYGSAVTSIGTIAVIGGIAYLLIK